MGKDHELLEAARNGNIPIVEKILSQRAKRSGPLASLRRGPGANVQDNSGYSALHHAALNGHREVVQLLLGHEASTNIADGKGSTPLHLAAWTGNEDIVRLLLCHGPSVPNVNLKTKDSETALHCAAQYGHTAVVAHLLEHSCDPSIRNSREETALDLAAQYGRLETVELLVRAHPELLNPFSRGNSSTGVFPHTPLHLASRNGHRAVVDVLLSAGMDVNARTAAGTALHEAALCGKTDCVRALLESGVDLSARDSGGHTVLDVLGQFPTHVTHDIMEIIQGYRDRPRSPPGGPRPAAEGGEGGGGGGRGGWRKGGDHHRRHRHRAEDSGGGGGGGGGGGVDAGAEDKENADPLPPIPTLGSPYENVRLTPKGGREEEDDEVVVEGEEEEEEEGVPVGRDDGEDSSPGHSPSSRWRYYDEGCGRHHRRHRPQGGRQRRGGREQGPPADGDGRTSAASTASAGSEGLTPRSQPLSLPHSHHHVHHAHQSLSKSLDSSCVSEDLSDLLSRDADRVSISSGSSVPPPSPLARGPSDAEGSTGASRHHRRCSHDAYVPMAPGLKVSPTPPKKPPRRNLSVSPTHPQLGECGGVAYEYLFLARSGHKGGEDGGGLTPHDLPRPPPSVHSPGREAAALRRGRSADQYVDMRGGCCPPHPPPGPRPSHDQDPEGSRQRAYCRRKLRRHNDHAYENYDPAPPSAAPCGWRGDVGGGGKRYSEGEVVAGAWAEEAVRGKKAKKKKKKRGGAVGGPSAVPLSPTHYQQPPTPDHPPPSALQAECSILERIRPLSQEYKRRSRDMETETEEGLLLGCGGGAVPSLDASSGSLSSSVSLSDRSLSTDNNVEEFLGDAPFAEVSPVEPQPAPPREGPNGPPGIRERLFKGSTAGDGPLGGTGVPGHRSLERPKTLRKLKNVYDGGGVGAFVGGVEGGEGATGDGEDEDGAGKGSLSILSPFDEQEEWNKISEIMASFGTGLVRESVFVDELEKEFQSLLGLSRSESRASTATAHPVAPPSPTAPVPTSIGQWLESVGLPEYEKMFVFHGYDDVDFINGVLEEGDLRAMGVLDEGHAALLWVSACRLPRALPRFASEGRPPPTSLEHWLRALRLETAYAETFRKNMLTDVERIVRIWEAELTTVLEISKLGHRRRLLASVGGGGVVSPMLAAAPGGLLGERTSSFSTPAKETAASSPAAAATTPAAPSTGTLRHRNKKNRPAPPPPPAAPTQPAPPKETTAAATTNGPEDLSIRDPAELLVGVPATLTTQWRHRPKVLLAGAVTYLASYLGSTLVRELRGTESTKKSIQKLKRSSRDGRVRPEIILSISYSGVKFLNSATKDVVCEHEIRNIHCACQDADDLTHFAYITKDHQSRDHYCHVFCVDTMEQATEIILTLGQAFEVAYQMALKEQFPCPGVSRGHTRSQSANQIVQRNSPAAVPVGGATLVPVTSNGNNGATHARSRSVNEIEVNGGGAARTPTTPTGCGKGVGPASPLCQAPVVFTEEM